MIEGTGDRPQDVGRSHKKRIGVSPETADLLGRYHAAMRLELDGLLDELWPTSGQLTLVGDVDRPGLVDRRALWDLAVKLGRELATAPASSEPSAVPGPRRAQPAPKLSVSQRRALGSS